MTFRYLIGPVRSSSALNARNEIFRRGELARSTQQEVNILMNPIYDFKGQVALVTGAAKGMGLATARMFAQSGASVVLADIDGDLAAKEAKRIVLEGGTAIGVACDVADEAQVAAMADRAGAEYGRLDMAFNNAGIQVPPSDAADEAIENFERVTAVNQRGVWACMKHELRVMRAQGSGAIVIVRPWAVSSASPSAPPITAPSTPCS